MKYTDLWSAAITNPRGSQIHSFFAKQLIIFFQWQMLIDESFWKEIYVITENIKIWY